MSSEAEAAQFPPSKAVILIGGPNQQGNHFRPLSLDLPKPLFQLAGREMLYFHVEACARVPNLQEILMIGSYDEGLFSRFFDSVWRRFNVQIRYLREEKALGTAGGIRFFRDEILDGNPASLFVLHCDVCCSFPLNEMMHFHLRHKGSCTVMGKRVFHDEAKKYGCLVADPVSKEILHWAEKPETFVSDIINCGVYLFDVALMDTIVSVGDKISRQRLRSESSSGANAAYDLKKLFPEFSNLDNLRCVQRVPSGSRVRRFRINSCVVLGLSGRCCLADWSKTCCCLSRTSTLCICSSSATSGARSRRLVWPSHAPSCTCSGSASQTPAL
jgi:mannose-1-phosphate guanylyltransferase